MKISLRIAFLALLLCCGAARAQVTPVEINPGGGGVTDNGLKITITETAVLTEYKGKKQYGDGGALPALDKGLHTYFMLERRWGHLPNENVDILRVTGCEISDVQGEGTAADPWMVVKLLSLNNQTGATFNISVVYTYEADKPWYRVDYLVSSNEQFPDATFYGPYLLHIFHSESSWIHEANCGLGFNDQPVTTTNDAYQNIHVAEGVPVTLWGRVGVRKGDGTCGAAAGSHFFKAVDGITSYNARDASVRDNKATPGLGYKLTDIITNLGPEVAAGVAIHKAILLGDNGGIAGNISHESKSFIVGFDETDDGPSTISDATFPAPRNIAFAGAKVGLSSSVPEGLEGNGDHVISGVWLNVKDATFNLPQVVHFRVTTTGTGTGHAGAGDYTVKYEKMIIPAGTYDDEMLPLKNIIIHGDESENEDKTLRIELLPNCSPHIDLVGETTAIYTIVDDDENKIFLEPAFPSRQEGQDMQITVKLTGAPRATATVVDIGINLLTAKATDFELEFPVTPMQVTIPAMASEATFSFRALSDQIIEATENVEITATTTFGSEVKTHAVTIAILDVTGAVPENRVITFTTAPTLEGETMTVTAALPAGVTSETAIMLNLTADWANPASTAKGADFVGGIASFPGVMIISADQGSSSFTLPIATDALLEPDEYLYFSAEDALGAYTVTSPVQLTLLNKATQVPGATIAFDSYENPEDGSTEIRGVVQLMETPSTPVTINVFRDPASTADENDFDVVGSLSLLFDPGDPAYDGLAEFSIRLLNDNVLEGRETLSFTFTMGDMVVEQIEPMRIYDEEHEYLQNRKIYLDQPAAENLTEGEDLQVKVRLNSGISAGFPITVNIGVGASVATPADYTLDPATSTVTFLPGETEKIITVSAIDDGNAEGSEKLELTFTASITTVGWDETPETIVTNLTKEINIVDAGSTSITLTPEATTLHEGGAQVKVTAALSFGTATAPITVTLDGLTGSEVTAADVELPPSVVIPKDASSVEFYVRAKTDDVLEDDETFVVSGSAAGYTITAANLTVTDATSLDDANKQITLEVETNPVAEGSSSQVWVKLPANITTSKPITITLSSGSATEVEAGEVSFPATVTIPAEGGQVSFNLNATTDNILELVEKLELVATGTGVLDGFTDTRVVNITDLTSTDPDNTAVTITSSRAGSVNEGDLVTYTFALPVHISMGYPLVISLDQQAGTTAGPADFTGGIDGTVTIPVSGRTVQLQLSAKSDGIIELPEKLIIKPASTGFTFDPELIDLTVVDTDLAGASIQLSVNQSTIEEGQSATVTATLVGATSEDDIVVSLVRGAASTTALTGDHSALGTITISQGTSSGSTTVTALADLVLEHDELLVLSGTSTPGTTNTVTITIEDKTGTTANKTISLVPEATEFTEGDDITVKVKLPDNITASEDIDVQIDGIAGAGLGAAEYSITPSTVKILAGNNAAEFTVAAVDDHLIEPDEQLTVQATATVYGHGPQVLTSVITIADKPGYNTITVTAEDASVTEGAAATKIHFSLPAGIAAANDIEVQLTPGGVATAADFDVLPASITIPAGAESYELTLTAVKDKIIEATETFTLTAAATGYTISGSVSLNVVDADLADAEIKLVPSSTDITEGNTLTLTAVFQNGMTTTIPIDITLSQNGGTAEATDYSGLTSIHIDPLDPASGTADIDILNDVFLEWAETLIIKGEATGLTVTGVTVNILDYNTTIADNIIFTLTPDAASLEEGGTTTVWVRLPAGQKTEEAITITLAAVTGTTLNADEYDFPATVTIPAGGDAVSFTLKAEEDNILELVEVLKLRASASVYGTNISNEASIDVRDKASDRIITITTVSGDMDMKEDESVTIEFSLPAGITSGSDIVVPLTATGMAEGVDFVNIPAAVTIKAGDPSAQITLNAVKDGLIEPLETLVLTPSLAGFTFTGTVSLNIEDADLADASIVLTTSPATVTEGADVMVTATLQGSVTSLTDIDIILHKTGSVADDDDHSPLGTIHIEAGEASGTFTITAKTDLLVENDESLVLGGTAGSIPVTGATVVIRDATDRSIVITPAVAAVAEGNSVTLTISLPEHVTATEKITVALAKTTGTTAADGEYVLPPSVEIPVGGNHVTFDVEALADNILEAGEVLNILATAGIFSDVKTATATVNIHDATNAGNDMLITVAGDVEVREGQPAPAEITFSLPAGVTTDYPVVITLTPGSATPAVDAADIAGGIPTSVTIPANGSSVTLQITALADAVIEPVEKLFLVPTAAGFTFSNNVMLDVKDEHHSGTITFSSDKVKILEGTETAAITVSLPGALVAGSNIQVDIQKGASTAGNTDHSALPAFVTIEAGKHDAVFTITAPADLVLEDDETLALEGTAPGYSVAGTSIVIGDATSLDPLNKVLRLTPVDANIAEGSTGDFAVRLPAGVTSGKNITVQLAKTAGASTAADTDHTQIPVSVTIQAEQNASDDFDISAVPDLIIEPTEKLRVDGVAPTGFTFEGTDIYITDATGLNPANMQIRILPDSAILHEGSTSKVIFALPAGVTSATDIAVNVTADGTLAAQQADYSLTPASIMLPKEHNTVTVILEALQDHLQEPTEQLRLTGTAAGYTVVPSHTITIPGDPAPHLTIAASTAADATEPAGNGAFRIQLSSAAPSDVTVTYTISGTATAGSDYETLSGQTVIKAGDTEVNIPVTVKDDDVVEGPEDVVITLQNAVFSFLGNTVNCTIGAATAAVQIADNDQVTLIIEKIADAAEPSTAGSVKIRFTNPQASSTVPVTVQYSVAGTAIPGTDYVALPGSVVIPAGSSEVTVPVQAVDDALLDGTKTVIIQLTSAAGALPGVTWPIGTPAEASVNVYDNDVVSMEIFGLNQVAEGATVPVTLKASQAIAVDIPVSIQLQHDAARTVSTNVPRSGDILTVVMPANQTEVSFNITVDENEINDDNGYVNLVIQPFTGTGQAYGKGASGNTATIVTDNDPLQISFRKDTVRIPEGNSGQAMMVFSLQLSRMSSRAIQVQYEFADAFEGAGADKDPQRAKAGDDFLASPTSITIPPMQAEADITVAVNGNTRQEADKYFALKLTNITVSGGVNAPVPGTLRTAVGVIENDDQDVDLEIRAHKGVSPNGDGKNDVWIIENIEKYSRNEVVIVNRWGGTIFKTSNYNNTSNNFSGIANIGSGTGKELPDGSYFYILQVWGSDGKVTRYNGYIVIKNGL